MKWRALDFLCCPACRGPLAVLNKREGGEEIVSATLRCGQCSAEYPVHRRRPTLMSTHGIHQWLAPIKDIATRLLEEAGAFFTEQGIEYFTVSTAVANRQVLEFYAGQGLEPLQTVLLGTVRR